MNIDEPAPPKDIAPLWRLAFRAGFLLAATFAMLGMARWLYWMISPASWDYTLAPNWWHAHEMVFGFAMPVVAGFLLSAVATWTGIPGTSGWRLQLLFGLWLLARVLLWLAPQYLSGAWLAEMLFLALLSYELGSRVWAKRQWRNMLFLPVLLVLAVLDTISFANADDIQLTTRLFYGTVWMITVLVVIIGGRVIPLFTGNRLGCKIPPLPPGFDYLAIGITALIGLVTAFTPWPDSATWLGPLCLVAAIIHLYRLFRWQGWKTFGIPLLWSMHLSYLCIPLAMLGLALTASDPIAGKNIMHLLAIGTIGGMIVSMMSRVSLGHTGRPLEVPTYLSWAFALVLLAAVIRALLPTVAPQLTPWAWQLSALLWIVAFGAFLWRYLPILTRPRMDDKAG
ncbi:MAG: NnrS family protein [Halioglobus sp.]